MAKVKALRTEELRAHTCSKAPAIAHLAHHLSKLGETVPLPRDIKECLETFLAVTLALG